MVVDISRVKLAQHVSALVLMDTIAPGYKDIKIHENDPSLIEPWLDRLAATDGLVLSLDVGTATSTTYFRRKRHRFWQVSTMLWAGEVGK